jgi:hypothetical protein
MLKFIDYLVVPTVATAVIIVVTVPLVVAAAAVISAVIVPAVIQAMYLVTAAIIRLLVVTRPVSVQRAIISVKDLVPQTLIAPVYLDFEITAVKETLPVVIIAVKKVPLSVMPVLPFFAALVGLLQLLL